MKEIKAVIQPAKLAKVRAALRQIKDFPGMSVNKVEGCGKHLQIPDAGVKEELTDYSPKVYIYMVVPDELVERILQVITEVAHTGNIGDGIVWVTPVERMIRLSEQIELLG